jgi:hypothetical protein
MVRFLQSKGLRVVSVRANIEKDFGAQHHTENEEIFREFDDRETCTWDLLRASAEKL